MKVKRERNSYRPVVITLYKKIDVKILLQIVRDGIEDYKLGSYGLEFGEELEMLLEEELGYE